MRKLAFCTVTVFCFTHASFERSENAQFAFDGNATQMGHFADLTRNRDVIIPVSRGLTVGLERAVHHDGRKTSLNCSHASGGFIAVVEMHANRNMWIDFRHRVHHVTQHDVVCVGTCAARSLQDNRRISSICRFHDGECLFHVVDVKCRNAIAVFSSVVEQLPQRNTRHVNIS